MAKEAFDYSEYKDETGANIGDNLLAQITGLAQEQKREEVEVARLEAELQAAKERLRDISEHKLPELMDVAEMQDFTTKEGIHIKVAEKIRASIAKQDLARQARAFRWLEDNGQGNLIKRQFTIAFGKDEEKWANKFEGDLKRRKRDLNVKRSKEVNSTTLAAFVKRQLEEGAKIPLETFGVMRQRFTKIESKDTT